MCSRWMADFNDFLGDLGERPSPKHQIDRIDNDKGYWCGRAECPDCGPLKREPNCHWTTPKQNCLNRRSTKWVIYEGQTLCMSDWAARFGVSIQALSQHVKRNGLATSFKFYADRMKPDG